MDNAHIKPETSHSVRLIEDTIKSMIILKLTENMTRTKISVIYII